MSTAAITTIAFFVGIAFGAIADMIASGESSSRNCSHCKYRLDSERKHPAEAR